MVAVAQIGRHPVGWPAGWLDLGGETYTANSHLATDVARTQDADGHSGLLERTYTYKQRRSQAQD
jgi:hypothetical protein